VIRKIATGTIIPREDGKLIDEHAGAVHTQSDAYSVARMVAPPGWKEPAQTAEFDELVLVMHGTLAVQADGRTEHVSANESCLVERGTRVTYSNASASEPCAYWSLCIPAFRPERTKIHA
jgi:mannose-6-phosphate isomerase-like protein (cupin superfamily)